MDKQWNERQLEAIEARGHSVVVSAAAGSGKTSVLTERVLRLIMSGEDIERMLVVTFTNMAAGEMKERIYRALQEAGQQPGGERLAAQAEKCAFADISTIHSYCGRLIRDHFEYAGVSPTVAIADDAQASMLKAGALESAVEQFDAPAFFGKYASRGSTRRIGEVVRIIYNRAICQRDPEQWLTDAEAHFDDPGFVLTLFEEYHAAAMQSAAEADRYLSERSDAWRMAGFDSVADESEAARRALRAAVEAMKPEDAWLPAVEPVGYKAQGAPWGESNTLTNLAAKCFDDLRDYEGDFAQKVRAELDMTAEDVRSFVGLTRAMMRAYAKAKRGRSLIDHDDTIHLALKVLSVPEIAQRCRAQYSHVFVDEYQDVNDAQHAIIALLTDGGNDFFVGDVKQCIYMFRESNPELLIRRCRELIGNGLIEMNVNYRSAPGVIRFINGVMRYMMTEDAGGVSYTGGHTLVAGKDSGGAVEVRLAGHAGDAVAAEAAQIGAVIRELVAEGYRYGDIAVLRPEISNSGGRIVRMLSDMDIPVLGSAGGEDSAFSELAVYVNLLRVVDSPVNDVPMLSVMRYPHFGFTEPELAAIRIAYKPEAEDTDRSFCAALAAFDGVSPLADKVGRFREELEHYRRLADSLPLPDFLMRLRQEAEFREYALTSPGGRGTDADIAEFIASVVAANPARLRDVIALAEHIGEKRDAQGRAGEDAVSLMTIHKSKGLEFRAVILSGMHKRINTSDASGGVLVGRSLGIGIEAVDAQRRVRSDTWHRQAVGRAMERERISETVRILYVGMTRAIERLFIVGAGEAIKQEWLAPKSEGWQHKAVTHLDLIMPAAAMYCAEQGIEMESIVRVPEITPEELQHADAAARFDALISRAQEAQPARLFERYAHEADLGVPSKVSVSALKRREQPEVPLKPAQWERTDDEIPAAERGTLMHRVLQLLGMGEKDAEQVKEGVHALVQKGLIYESLAAHIDAGQIAAFLKSDVAARARRSTRCLLEQPFCLRMSAQETGLADSEEDVIVQGVIDLCFVENGHWVLVDYKTDAIRTTAREAAEKYILQLALYEKALQRITKIPVSEKLVFLLSAGEAVRLA